MHFEKVSLLITRVSWPLVLVGSFVLILGTSLILNAVVIYGTWFAEDRSFEVWKRDGVAAACQQIEADCFINPEAAAGGVPEPGTDDGFRSDEELLLSILKREAHTTDDPEAKLRIASEIAEMKEKTAEKLAVRRCVKARMSAGKLACFRAEPYPLADRYREEVVFERPWAKASALWLGFLVLFTSVRVLLQERHVGWRRVTIIAGPVLSIATILMAWSSDFKAPAVVVAGGSGLCAGFVIPPLARRCAQWVRDGFSGKETTQVASTELASTTRIVLTWAIAGKLLLVILAMGAFGALLVFRPEKTIRTVVVTLVQGFLFVGLVVLVRLVSSRFRK